MIKVKGYEIRPELFYDPQTHLWLRVEGRKARVGIDPLEQETRGAFVVMKLEAVGKSLKRGDGFGSVEAEKHVGALNSPVSGTITAVNPAVIKNPRLANSDPYGDGWFVEVELNNFEAEKKELLTGEADLRGWYLAEIQKYADWGWLAES